MLKVDDQMDGRCIKEQDMWRAWKMLENLKVDHHLILISFPLFGSIFSPILTVSRKVLFGGPYVLDPYVKMEGIA